MLRRVVETCTPAVSWLIKDGKYAAISPAYQAIFGNITGRYVADSHPPECALRYMDHDRRAWSGETVAAIEDTPAGSYSVVITRCGDYLLGIAAPITVEARDSESLARIA